MAAFKNCKNCGTRFKVSKDRRFYCCDDCRRIMGHYRKKQAKIKSNYNSIAEITRKAMELNMSYGDYVAKFGL